MFPGRRSVALTLLGAVLAAGCAVATYPGPRRRPEEVAVVRGMNKFNLLLAQNRQVFVRSVDGRETATPLNDKAFTVELLPGRHVLALVYYESTLGMELESDEECRVVFQARAGRTYTAHGDYGMRDGDRSEWRCSLLDDATGERFPGSVLPPVFPHRRYAGFTCKPPADNGWGIASWTEDELVLERYAPSPPHALTLFVRRTRHGKRFQAPDDFLEHVRGSYFSVDPGRYDFLAKDALPDPRFGPSCVRYGFAYRVGPEGRGGGAPYVSTGRCYACLHPRAPEYEYRICAQDDSRSGEADPGFVAEGEAFLESFAFTEIDR